MNILKESALVLLPNVGFWLNLIVHRTHYTFWYVPTHAYEEMFRDLLNTCPTEYREKANKLEKQLKKLEKKRGTTSEQLAELQRELKSAKESLTEAENKSGNIIQQHKSDCHRQQLPLLWKVTSLCNLGMGLASYIIWKDEAKLPLLIYGGLLCLCLTFYPVLFIIGSKQLSATQATAMTLLAGMTTAVFWHQNTMAGLLMIPFDLILLLVTQDITSKSKKETDVRLALPKHLCD